ncbi:MAG: hypothetical protein U0973_13605 [Xanthomonadaceae bacterium]|nr:hypothetical protein [Xanthomonadaceae bacterium]
MNRWSTIAVVLYAVLTTAALATVSVWAWSVGGNLLGFFIAFFIAALFMVPVWAGVMPWVCIALAGIATAAWTLARRLIVTSPSRAP